MTGNGADAPCVSVVIPAHSEIDNLRELLPGIIASLSELGISHEVLVIVSTTAPDEELEEIRRLGGRAVRRGPTDSFGQAIRTGLQSIHPEATYAITMDADGSHSPGTLPRLVAAAPGNDVVVASRYVTGGSTFNGPVLTAMSRLLNHAYRLVLGIPCSDLSTNYKLYRRELLSDITIASQNFDAVEELLFRVKVRVGTGFRLVEIPDAFHERRHGESKRRLGPFIASYLITLCRLRLSASDGAAR